MNTLSRPSGHLVSFSSSVMVQMIPLAERQAKKRAAGHAPWGSGLRGGNRPGHTLHVGGRSPLVKR